MNLKFVYKIINHDELQKAKLSGTYSGSSKDIKDGYIHFSNKSQVLSTLNKYFYNEISTKGFSLLCSDSLFGLII